MEAIYLKAWVETDPIKRVLAKIVRERGIRLQDISSEYDLEMLMSDTQEPLQTKLDITQAMLENESTDFDLLLHFMKG